MKKITEKRDGKNVIALRQDGKVKWALCSAGKGDAQTQYLYGEHADRLAEYEDAEEQGLLVRLPCKVGDVIYVKGVLGVGESEEYKVIRVYYQSDPLMKRSKFYVEALLVSDPRNSIGFYDKEIGKTVFLTKEKAEAKLKEMRGK